VLGRVFERIEAEDRETFTRVGELKKPRDLAVQLLHDV
jgi:hypothetical protein